MNANFINCPRCDCSIKSSNDIFVVCPECNVEFENDQDDASPNPRFLESLDKIYKKNAPYTKTILPYIEAWEKEFITNDNLSEHLRYVKIPEYVKTLKQLETFFLCEKKNLEDKFKSINNEQKKIRHHLFLLSEWKKTFKDTLKTTNVFFFLKRKNAKRNLKILENRILRLHRESRNLGELLIDYSSSIDRINFMLEEGFGHDSFDSSYSTVVSLGKKKLAGKSIL